MGLSGAPVPSKQIKYFDLLARYYVLKRQHALAAHVLLRLAERRSTDAGDVPTLEQRLATPLFKMLISHLLSSIPYIYPKSTVNLLPFKWITLGSRVAIYYSLCQA